MGQCGCGDTHIDKAFKLPDGKVVAYDIYHGCRDCFAGPGAIIYVYADGKSEWLGRIKPMLFTPDEDGGDHGRGIHISFFEVSDMVNAAKSIGSLKTSCDGYLTFADWLEDNGLQMMQDAMRLFNTRMEKQAKEMAKRKKER